MTKEQFKARWLDTHTEVCATDVLRKGSFANGSLARETLSRSDMAEINVAKKAIEREGVAKRAENLTNFMLDSVEVRGSEVLDPDKLPIKDLLGLTIKLMPQQAKIQHTGEVNFTFTDMIAKASIDLDRIEDIDVSD